MTERRPNYLGIFAGAIVLFVVGCDLVHGASASAWMAGVGKSKDQLGLYGFWPFVISFLAGLLVSYCFDNMLWHYEHGNAAKGAQVGFLTGVCIFFAMLVNLYAFQAQSISLMLIDGAYGIIGFVLAGATVGALRARATRSASRAA